MPGTLPEKRSLMIRTTMFANLLLCGALWGQGAAPAPAAPAAPGGQPSVAGAPYRNQPNRISNRAGRYYGLVWGVDLLRVKWAESGEIIRFSYRVVDPDRAQPLNDKKLEPSLIDPEAGVSLVVPMLEKVGSLRQTPTGKPELGKSYWMAFSNAGRRVKQGDRVDVVIGNFRAQGLVVE
jgi:hypothetical protein